MKRKVIQIADSTQLVSLPRKWAIKFNIRKGDELDVAERENSVIVSTQNRVQTQKVAFDTAKQGMFHPNHLSAMYHQGIEDVDVTFNDTETIKRIKERIPNCIGYEIVNQGRNFCHIKTVSHASHEEFDNILHKVFSLVSTMSHNVNEAINNKDVSQLTDIFALETTVNRLTDFCRRILNKRGHSYYEKTLVLMLVVSDLERIGDDYRDICRELTQMKTVTMSPAVHRIMNMVEQLIQQQQQFFYRFNAQTNGGVYEQIKVLNTEALGLMKKSKSTVDRMVLHYVLGIMQKLYELSVTTFEYHITPTAEK